MSKQHALEDRGWPSPDDGMDIAFGTGLRERLARLESVMQGEDAYARKVAADLEAIALEVSAPDGLAGLDTREVERIAGAAFWFVMEGTHHEMDYAVFLFRELADGAKRAMDGRLDRHVQYGNPVTGEELAALDEAMAEIASLPSAGGEA